MCEKGCIIFPDDSMLKVLKDDSTREIGGRKDWHEEEGSNPPETMDDSTIDGIFDGEWQYEIQKKMNLWPGDFRKTHASNIATAPSMWWY